MPRRKPRTARASSNRDIEAVRKVIASGVPWLAPDQHRELTPGLTLEQRALLGNLTPYRSAAKFICDLNPDVVALAKLELKADIAAAKAEYEPSNAGRKKNLVKKTPTLPNGER